MPTLHWIGKEKVINHHLVVPLRSVETAYTYGTALNSREGDSSSDNKIIHGDNLEALKALLPLYEGKVKCIYIDPPYNTGNEKWVYNDNVNDPKLRKWLAQVVGKEGEDLSRHDKWLCMMYPRLQLLKKLLADDGAIFISIDDNEQAHLKLVCDEIFGIQNFVSNIIWEKKYTVANDAKYFSNNHDFIITYAKNISEWKVGRLDRTEKMNLAYRNPDNHPKGVWKATPLQAKSGSDANFVHVFPTGFGHAQVAPEGRAAAAHDGLEHGWTDFGKLLDQQLVGFGWIVDKQIVATSDGAQQRARRVRVGFDVSVHRVHRFMGVVFESLDLMA